MSNEREAFERWLTDQISNPHQLSINALVRILESDKLLWRGFQAGAAYQREQVKGVGNE